MSDCELLGVFEVSELLQVSRQRISQLLEEDPSFTRPVAHLRAGRIWRKDEIEAWKALRDERQQPRTSRDKERKQQ